MPSKQPVSTQDQKGAKRSSGKLAQVQDAGIEKGLDIRFAGQQGRSDANLLSPGQIMQMQATVGNQATNRVLSGLRPRSELEDENPILGGFPHPMTDQGGQVMRVDGETEGEAVEVSTATNFGPAWLDHGEFEWDVSFTTNGRLGWILQEMTNTYDARDMGGYDVTPVYAPHYWEAWEVDEVGRVTPNVGRDNDYWTRVSRGPNTRGTWTMDAAVYWSTTDPTTQGFILNGVMDAGEMLLSTYENPPDPGMLVLSRGASGAWDSTGATPTHSGTAMP